MSERTLFESPLAGLAPEARRDVLDGLYCALNNNGHALLGNTAETDLAWFARRLYDTWGQGVGPPWDGLGQRRRDDWFRIARAALAALPLLMQRVGDRCVLHSRVLGTVLDAERRRNPAGEYEASP